MKPIKFSVRFDHKRYGYFVNGNGFDFFLYFTTGDFLECDSVQVNGSGYEFSISIYIGKAIPSCDLVETLVAREISRQMELLF